MKHFTVTCYIIKDGKFLLLFHPKHQKWLPPGGHLEPNETPEEGLYREVFEETGLTIKLISDENLWIQEENATSTPRPYLCLLEFVPERANEAAHQHIDLIYVAEPVPFSIETAGRWFLEEEVALLEAGHEIFADTKQIIKHLLHSIKEALQQEC